MRGAADNVILNLLRQLNEKGAVTRNAHHQTGKILWPTLCIAQRIGIPLATIGEAFGVLPEGHTLSKKEWKALSSQWREELDRRIHTLVALRDELDGCIGCGCLSRSDCPLRNPGDTLGKQGPGARLLEDE